MGQELEQTFTANEWQRYQRQVQLNKFGVDGQTHLKNANILIVGAGGLGCPAAQYLAAAGIGNITLVDADTVSRSNLHRQILFTEQDIGKSKAEAAASRMRDINPNINVVAVPEHLSPNNIETLANNCNLILDCTDDITIRYLINDHCLHTNTPWIYASVERFNGQLTLFTGESACFRCLFPAPPYQLMDCNSAGVLGTVPGILATLQANEAVKFLAGIESNINGHLLVVDTLSNNFRSIKLKKNSTCPCHSNKNNESNESNERNKSNAQFPEPQTPNHCSTSITALTPSEFKQKTHQANHLLIDVRTAKEHSAFNIGGINIDYNDDTARKQFAELEYQNQEILLYCQSGIRSQKAKEYLETLGCDTVFSLQGGIENWLENT